MEVVTAPALRAACCSWKPRLALKLVGEGVMLLLSMAWMERLVRAKALPGRPRTTMTPSGILSLAPAAFRDAVGLLFYVPSVCGSLNWFWTAVKRSAIV